MEHPEAHLRPAGDDVRADLVAAKIVPPFLPRDLLPRDDLVARLTTSDTRFCLIDAPAGWGKSSLLAAWRAAAGDQTSFAFVGLDPDDDDAAVFWAYVIAALRTVHPALAPDADALLRTPGVEPMRRLIPDLANELRSIEGSLVLVLDDYHVISRAGIHDAVRYLVEHLPPSVRLAVATRADPPLPLGRWRASGEMTEIRARQLAFSEAEAARLLDERFGVAMDAASTHLLWDRTEGWPAALQLAGLSLEAEADHAAFVKHFAGDDRNVADYLTGEALGQLGEERRRFLVHTSVLDHLTGSLCDAVTGDVGSAAVLEDLEHRNLFLVPLDSRRSWYRYHHLFREWLRHELQRSEPDMAAELHRRAGRWHADHGALESAVSHAIEAGDHEEAASLIDRFHAFPWRINFGLMHRWLQGLPDTLAVNHPWLAIMHVWFTMAVGDFAASARWIDVATAGLDAVPPEARRPTEALVRLYGAYVELVTGDLDAARTGFAEIAEASRQDGAVSFATAAGGAGMATFWSVGPVEALPYLLEGSQARERLSLTDGGTTAHLALAYAEVGDRAAARSTADKALGLPRRWDGYTYPDEMTAHFALGRVCLLEGDKASAVGHITRGLELARGWVEPLFVAYGCLALSEAVDDFMEKRALVREARQLLEGRARPGRVQDLVAAAERKLSMRQPVQGTADTAYIEPLSERELDVLRMLRSDLSLREIASELFVSYNTVKGHTKAIYRKLGVSSREAAITSARELDLL